MVCGNCVHCQYLGSPLPNIMYPFDCRCLRNNGLVSQSNKCDWFELREERCSGCVHFSESGIGVMCSRMREASRDSVACCEWVGV